MSLDAEETRLTKVGSIKMLPGMKGRIYINGFEGDNCTCRDVGVLALTYAIRRLSKELQRMIERPGGSSRVVID